ncbi:hypothetical protein DXG03_008835 [Asterophora parasitica]|uniref:Glucose-methanol-choline oxidoreductase N-terminal domain-containing protein n=1 Tax=Asterophora parasitica TaxID=117018 RepID=A0A9P7G7J4_9AGAR|nr:hypothetical protein DXG03_008835 [Asterophora parasitica]
MRTTIWIGISIGLCVLFASGVNGIQITDNPSDVLSRIFSYVVIGGGTAGITVASRLSEDSGISVLVIEAGPNAQNDPIVNDPGQSIPVTKVYDWGYKTTAQAFGGKIHDMTQYMKKAESYNLPNPQQTSLGASVNPGAHGYSGKVNAGFPQPYEATVAAGYLVTAAQAAIPGLVHNPDVASGNPNGAARFQYSIKPGTGTVVTPDGNTRSSSATAFIYPSLLQKPNLVILTGHQATRLLWGNRVGSLSRASGVKFASTPVPDAALGPEYTVKFSKEAIVASGAIGSPHFLELSGIGDKRILRQVGIPVEVDLPSVGTNLQDQALDAIAFAVHPDAPASEYSTINVPFTPAAAFVDIEQVLGKPGARAVGKELRESIPARAKAIVASGAFTSEKGLIKVLRSQADSILRFKELTGVFQARNSSCQIQEPECTPQTQCNRLARKIFNTSPLREFTVAELVPGLAAIPNGAPDAQWQDYVKNAYSAVLHPIGSVPMLPRKDGGAVGPDLKVYGTANVRVVGE